MKDSARFYSSLGLLLILNIIIKPLWIFGIDRQVQNTVGLEAYGTYFSLFNFSLVFGFLLDWGFTSFFNRQLAAREKEFMNSIGNFLLLRLLLTLVYIIVVCSVAWFSHIKRWDILWGVIAIQVLTYLFVFLRSIITAEQWFRTDAWLSVLDKTLMILLCGSLLYFPSAFGMMSINNFLLVQVACTSLAVISVLAILFRRGVSFSITKSVIPDARLFKMALPFAITMLLMTVHNRLDGFMLERMHSKGAYEAGVYATAYRLLDAANMIGYLLGSFLLPYMARRFSEKKDFSDAVLNGRHLLIMSAVFISVTAFFMAPWIQQILYHHDDASAISVLQWCLPALIGYSLVQVYGTVMTATGHIVSFSYINLVAVIINIGLNFWLIPSLGAKGSCYAALSSQVFCGLACMIYVRQKLNIRFHFQSLLTYIFIAATLWVFYYFGKDVLQDKKILIAGAAFVTLIMAIVTRLFRVRNWMNLLKGSSLNT